MRARAAQLVRSEHGERVEQRGQRALAPDLADEVPALMIRVLAFTLAVIVPLLVAVGILLTFRTAGPLYRLETHLEAVIAGRETGPCRLRDGDELQQLRALVNEALDVARQSASSDLRKST